MEAIEDRYKQAIQGEAEGEGAGGEGVVVPVAGAAEDADGQFVCVLMLYDVERNII